MSYNADHAQTILGPYTDPPLSYIILFFYEVGSLRESGTPIMHSRFLEKKLQSREPTARYFRILSDLIIFA